mmetsp:Transcript_30553/g.88726  ORF Transcript_30553/g.88726 Transcript_30553/m.88726 type:complete len:241 (-) Transcript_30553:101-823(-)
MPFFFCFLVQKWLLGSRARFCLEVAFPAISARIAHAHPFSILTVVWMFFSFAATCSCAMRAFTILGCIFACTWVKLSLASPPAASSMIFDMYCREGRMSFPKASGKALAKRPISPWAMRATSCRSIFSGSFGSEKVALRTCVMQLVMSPRNPSSVAAASPASRATSSGTSLLLAKPPGAPPTRRALDAARIGRMSDKNMRGSMQWVAVTRANCIFSASHVRAARIAGGVPVDRNSVKVRI